MNWYRLLLKQRVWKMRGNANKHQAYLKSNYNDIKLRAGRDEDGNDDDDARRWCVYVVIMSKSCNALIRRHGVSSCVFVQPSRNAI